jgi:uncharacterized protein (TIGR02217 family)
VYPVNTTGSESGWQQRASVWTRPLIDFNVSFGCGRTQWETLDNFLAAHKYGTDAFIFRDPFSNAVTTATAFGTGTGSLAVFQLKTITAYSSKTRSWSAKMIVTGTEKIYLNGTLRTTAYTLNTETGVITFSSPLPGNGVALTATFSYDWKVACIDQPEYPHDNPSATTISLTLHEVI